MRRFDVSPRRATPKGHNLHHLHSTASRRPPYIGSPFRAHGAPKPITLQKPTAISGADEAWFDRFYRPDTQALRDRLLFST